MILPWQWHHSDCALQQALCAFRHPARCAAPPDTPHGTTPTYRAMHAPLLSLGIGTSIAFVMQVDA